MRSLYHCSNKPFDLRQLQQTANHLCKESRVFLIICLMKVKCLGVFLSTLIRQASNSGSTASPSYWERYYHKVLGIWVCHVGLPRLKSGSDFNPSSTLVTRTAKVELFPQASSPFFNKGKTSPLKDFYQQNILFSQFKIVCWRAARKHNFTSMSIFFKK